MSIFVTVPTLSLPVQKTSKDGIPTRKTIDYAVECSLGNNKLLNFTLRQFYKNGKSDPTPYVIVTIDLNYNVTVKMFESPNTKGFTDINGATITNIAPLIVSHYLANYSDIKGEISGVIVDQSFLLFNALLPLFDTELSSKDWKTGITRKIKTLAEKDVQNAWLNIVTTDDVITKIQEYIKQSQTTQTNKTASKAV